MKIQIREATDADLPGMLPLLAMLEREGAGTIDEEQARNTLRAVHDIPNCTIYVAEVDHQVAGMFELFIMPNLAHQGMPSAIVEDVAVRPELQGKGIGTQMMQFAMNAAKAAGCYKITLSSGLQRKAAHRFYESLGYERYAYCFTVNPIP